MEGEQRQQGPSARKLTRSDSQDLSDFPVLQTSTG
jgi:hypothetical protein